MNIFGLDISVKRAVVPAERGIGRVPFVWNWNYGNELWRPRDFDTLLRAYRSWVYVASNKNAQTVAQIPLRLYGVKESRSEKFLFRSKKISAKTYKQIETSGHIQSLPCVRKAVEIEELIEHPAIDLFNNVNPFTNQFDLIELTQLYQELAGNSYWYTVRNNLGVPVEIWPLPPQYITIIPDRDNFITGYMYRIGSYEARLEENEIIHFKFPNPADVYYGISPLSAAATAYNINENMNRYESAMFRNNGRLEGAFETENELDEESFKRLKLELKENFAGVDRSGTMPLLERGVKFKPYSLPPKEMAFLQGRKWTKEEILNAYGQSLGMYDENATRANSETADYTFKRDTIRPRAIRNEQKINEKFMPMFDENIFIMFDNPVPEDRDYALRERESNLRTYYSSVNIERMKVGDEPVPWGDTPLVPFSVVALGIQAEEKQAAHGHTHKKMAPVEGDKKTVIWKQFAARQNLHEGRVKKELSKLFDEQRKEVLRNLKKFAQGADGMKAVITKESVESLLFSRDKWNKQFAKRVNDMIARTADDGVDFGEAQIEGLAEFEIGRTQVEAFLEKYKVRLSKTIWPDVNDETYDQLREAMIEGVAENEGITELRKRIDTIFDNSIKYRSERIARTETVRAYNAGTVESWKISEVVKGKSWLTERDGNQCEYCDAMDGVSVGLEENFFDKGDEIEGESGGVITADYGDTPSAPLHPNCFVDHNVPIYTSKGWTQIKDIQVGDLVLTHKKRFKKVTQLLRSKKHSPDVVKIWASTGGTSRKWSLTITPDHPVLINEKWIKAGDVKIGDVITFLAGECPRCKKPIPYFNKYCSNSCCSKDITERQWADPAHRLNMSKKTSAQLKREYAEGIRDSKTITREANKVTRQMVKDGLCPLVRPDVREKMKKGYAKHLPRIRKICSEKMKANNPNHIPEVRNRMTESYRAFLKLHPEKRLVAICQKPGFVSKIEKDMQRILNELNIEYVHQYKIGRYRVDFAIPKLRIVIEVDGEYWHQDKEKDARRQKYIEAQGWFVLRYGEKQINDCRIEVFDEVKRLLCNHTGKYNFTNMIVKNVEKRTEKRLKNLYNFSVEEDESYIAKGFVVHNCRCSLLAQL